MTNLDPRTLQVDHGSLEPASPPARVRAVQFRLGVDRVSRTRLGVTLAAALLVGTWSRPGRTEDAAIRLSSPPEFVRDVLPILEKNCAPCHSGPRRKHGLDVRQRRLLLRGGDTGPAVVPEDPNRSLLLAKIVAGEMPPRGREKLSAAEVSTIRRWIELGAPIDGDEKALVESERFVTPADREHWAFRLIRRSSPPETASTRSRGPIDDFLLSRLEPLGLDLAPDAPKRVLIRRAAIALSGLPPSIDEIAAFEADTEAGAFERRIESFLASPRYGERMARLWLDIAGYADSEGATESDRPRPDTWKYRDWVVRAFDEDKPWDEFLREQIAGDELVGGKLADLAPREIDLLTATGYLRLAADGTAERAADVAARNQVIADTVQILSSGLLALTVGCAQCHDHRYDPISQRDYHRIRSALEPAYDIENWRTPDARRVSLQSAEDRQRATAIDAEVQRLEAAYRETAARAVVAALERVIEEKIPESERATARAAHAKKESERNAAERDIFSKYPFLDISAGTLYQYDAAAAADLERRRSEIDGVRATRPVEEFVRALTEIPGRIPSSRLLIRGDPSQPAEEVPPGGLEVLAGEEAAIEFVDVPLATGTSGRRMRLANWLTSGDARHLVARVFVNRIWHAHFGRGLVEPLGDFGAMGSVPDHPELLDWLAAEFIDSGWSVKQLHRVILGSTAFRQSSVVSDAARTADPEARLLSRKPLLRLEGELLRDAILEAADDLSLVRFGPPVPVKEDAVGRIVVGEDRKAASNLPGEDVTIGAEDRRRSIWITVRRSRPLSFTTIFDAPVLVTNCVERARSTTASQALTLLNDDFVTAAADRLARAAIAKRATNGIDGSVGGEIDEWSGLVVPLIERILGRTPNADERRSCGEFVTAECAAHLSAGVADPEARRLALRDLAQVILNSSEFLYVE
jgi:hypothetical protein